MKQITVKEYLSLSKDSQFQYDVLLENVKPKEIIKANIDNLTYNDVKVFFKQLSKNEVDVKELFTKSLSISEEDFFSLPIQKYFQIKKYLIKFYISLHEREMKLLSSVNADTGLWEMAGGSKLNEFSDVLALSQLSKIYGGYPFDYGEKKYIEILYLLRMNNVQSQVETEYQKLKNK